MRLTARRCPSQLVRFHIRRASLTAGSTPQSPSSRSRRQLCRQCRCSSHFLHRFVRLLLTSCTALFAFSLSFSCFHTFLPHAIRARHRPSAGASSLTTCIHAPVPTTSTRPPWTKLACIRSSCLSSPFRSRRPRPQTTCQQPFSRL